MGPGGTLAHSQLSLEPEGRDRGAKAANPSSVQGAPGALSSPLAWTRAPGHPTTRYAFLPAARGRELGGYLPAPGAARWAASAAQHRAPTANAAHLVEPESSGSRCLSRHFGPRPPAQDLRGRPRLTYRHRRLSGPAPAAASGVQPECRGQGAARRPGEPGPRPARSRGGGAGAERTPPGPGNSAPPPPPGPARPARSTRAAGPSRTPASSGAARPSGRVSSHPDTARKLHGRDRARPAPALSPHPASYSPPATLCPPASPRSIPTASPPPPPPLSQSRGCSKCPVCWKPSLVHTPPFAFYRFPTAPLPSFLPTFQAAFSFPPGQKL